MNNNQSFMAWSSFHAGSFTSFKKEVEITPAEFSKPAGLNAVAIDAEASFSPERWPPANRPGKCLGVAPRLVAGSNEELGDILFVQVFSCGKIFGGSERPEHQKHIVLLDQATRQFQRS